MPLNLECVIAYLAVIRAGSRVVSIADSFPALEVRRRMAIVGGHLACTVRCSESTRSSSWTNFLTRLQESWSAAP